MKLEQRLNVVTDRSATNDAAPLSDSFTQAGRTSNASGGRRKRGMKPERCWSTVFLVMSVWCAFYWYVALRVKQMRSNARSRASPQTQHFHHEQTREGPSFPLSRVPIIRFLIVNPGSYTAPTLGAPWRGNLMSSDHLSQAPMYTPGKPGPGGATTHAG